MIELISIHIAKTGGKSLYGILRNEYGEKLDARTRRVDYFPDKDYSKSLTVRIPDEVRVLHGHLHYSHIEDVCNMYNPKIITWLREPVERVISNYYFMIQRANDDGKKHPQYHKRNHTLLEYARDSVPNKMSKCLEGIDLEALYYFGFQESFNDDVKTLAKKLGWTKNIPDIYLNAGISFDSINSAPTRKKDITDAMKNEIAELNKKDILLYEKAKSIKISQ
jgi:hypothetical protein